MFQKKLDHVCAYEQCIIDFTFCYSNFVGNFYHGENKESKRILYQKKEESKAVALDEATYKHLN